MFIRYNETNKYYEYDTSGGAGTGPWLILPLDYTQIYNPPVIPPPFVLPGNIAYIDQPNVFSRDQLISKNQPTFFLNEADGAPDQRLFRIIGSGGNLYIQATNDAVNAASGYIILQRDGSLNISRGARAGVAFYEGERVYPMGYWQDIPFNAAKFSSLDPLVFTVVAGNVVINRYTLVGKTMTWALQISNGVLTGAPSSNIYLTLPDGVVAGGPASMTMSVARIHNNGWRSAIIWTTNGAPWLTVGNMDFASFSLDPNFYLQMVITFEIQ